MGRRVLEFDWAATPLGPPDTWSDALRTAVGVCLTSRFPLLVVWGDDLIKLYNDAYIAMLGSVKHPGALGARASDVWGEIWDIIGPMFESVCATGLPTWAEHQCLVINRYGYLEECFFTYSYSPLFEADGTVGGVLDVATETTDLVLAQRRLTGLAQLSAALLDADQVTDVCVRATASLAGCSPDVIAAEVFLRTGTTMSRVSSNRREDVGAVDADVLHQVSETGVSVVIGGDEHGSLPAEHVLTPIGGRGDEVRGVLVTTVNPRRPFDADYRLFIDLIAGTIGSALESAYRRAVEVGAYRSISDTLQQAMLKPSSDLPSVAARYLPAVGNLSVGGDWYDVIDVSDDCRALVVGDCVGHGLEAATAMAQLRSAARAMLLEGRDPASTLEGLDRFARSTDHAFCATVVCALVDRVSETITYSSAGHPPPLVIHASGVSWLDGGGVPLAVSATTERVNTTRALGREDVVVLYSDGLIERRDETLDAGLERLAEAASALRGSKVHDMADELLRRLLPRDAQDDVVLVVKQLLR
jgi:hypothetical protein